MREKNLAKKQKAKKVREIQNTQIPKSAEKCKLTYEQKTKKVWEIQITQISVFCALKLNLKSCLEGYKSKIADVCKSNQKKRVQFVSKIT